MNKRSSPADDRYRPASRITFTVRRNGRPRLRVPNSHAAAKLITKSRLIPDDGREHFGVFLLDHQSRLLGYYEVGVGRVNEVLAGAREIFAAALNVPDTWGIILVHNHVIGSVKPSRADRRLTRHLSRIGAALDVHVLDHLIISMSTRGVYSFACANEARARRKLARMGENSIAPSRQEATDSRATEILGGARAARRRAAEPMPAPPELPSFTSDEQPAPARQARTLAAASQAQVGHDARAEAISANVYCFRGNYVIDSAISGSVSLSRSSCGPRPR